MHKTGLFLQTKSTSSYKCSNLNLNFTEYMNKKKYINDKCNKGYFQRFSLMWTCSVSIDDCVLRVYCACISFVLNHYIVVERPLFNLLLI